MVRTAPSLKRCVQTDVFILLRVFFKRVFPLLVLVAPLVPLLLLLLGLTGEQRLSPQLGLQLVPTPLTLMLKQPVREGKAAV